MPDNDVSPLFSMPLLVAGQAQKEITHNEALVVIDALIAGSTLAAGLNAPATSPQPGQCWLVGESPSGAWSGQARALAIWTFGGWRFVQMPLGSVIRVGTSRVSFRRTESGWVAPPHLAAPSGGTVMDSECRIALNQVITALETAGITSPS